MHRPLPREVVYRARRALADGMRDQDPSVRTECRVARSTYLALDVTDIACHQGAVAIAHIDSCVACRRAIASRQAA